MSITQEITSPQFRELETGFTKWLKTLNYSEATIKTRKRNLKEFLLYLERCGIYSVENMNNDKVKLFVRYLQRRENRRYGSGLMNASINVAIGSVNKFFDYLQQSGNVVPDNLKYLEDNCNPKNILTMPEIQQLYDVTYQQHHFVS
jgi:site-specific recombinase XerD